MWPPWLLLLPWGRDLSLIGDLLNEGGDGGGDDGGDDDGGGDGDERGGGVVLPAPADHDDDMIARFPSTWGVTPTGGQMLD